MAVSCCGPATSLGGGGGRGDGGAMALDHWLLWLCHVVGLPHHLMVVVVEVTAPVGHHQGIVSRYKINLLAK